MRVKFPVNDHFKCQIKVSRVGRWLKRGDKKSYLHPHPTLGIGAEETVWVIIGVEI
jgi:hypothetical protein